MQEVKSHYRLLQELEEMKGRLSELGQRRFGEAWERMRKNENRYRSLFEDASTGLWEEDWSLIQEYLLSLQDSGIVDLKSYFACHPSSVATCLDLIRLLDVNRAALDLCGTDHKRKFCLVSGASPAGPAGPAGRRVMEGILAIFGGADHFSCQFSLELPSGSVRHLLMKIQVPPGSRPSLERVFLSVTDVTELKETEKKLRRRLQLEEMIQDISRRFLFEADLDRAIEESLAEVGRFVGASRSYVFLFDPEMTRMDNTHEWCTQGVSQEIENLQGIPVAGRDWWMDLLREKRQIVIEDLEALPKEAEQERKDLEVQDIRSLVVIAFQVNQRPLGGFVGFDNVWRKGGWDREDLTILRMLADLIGNALGNREAARLVKAREERFSSLFNSISDAVYVYPFPADGSPGKFSEVNDVACIRLGYSREELLQKGPLDVIAAEDHAEYYRRMEILAREGKYTRESEIVTRQGRHIPVEITVNLVVLDGGEYVIALSRDISDRRDSERRMEYLASHDPLTDLLNRKTMDRLLEWESEKCRRQSLPMGILLVDIDDLDSVNVAYGNSVGDEIILDVARILREEAGKKALVGRYGGDRFLLLIPGEKVEESGLSLKIGKALEKRNREYQDPDLSISVSQGVADWDPLRGLPVSAALIEAGRNLAGSREEHGGRYRKFHQQRLHWDGK